MLPFVYNELSETQRDSVQMISLVGLAHHADFRIRVSGWMGFGTVSYTHLTLPTNREV